MDKPSFNDEDKKKKIFILGSTGFVGNALTICLIKLGFKNLFCLYRDEEKKNRLFQNLDTSAITFLKGSISDRNVLEKGILNAAIIFNGSAIASDWGIKKDIWEVNVDAPKTILEICRSYNQKTQFIQLSSAGIFGHDRKIKSENSPIVISDPFYTSSKVALTTFLRQKIQNNNQVSLTIIYPSIIWGPGDQIYIPAIIDRLRKGLLMYIKGAEECDFVHINDVLNGCLLCFFNQKAYNNEYILNGPTRFSINLFIKTIAEFTSLKQPNISMSMNILLGIAIFMELVARCINIFNPYFKPLLTRFQVRLISKPLFVCSKKAEEELGYTPKINFENGINTIRDYCLQLSS